LLGNLREVGRVIRTLPQQRVTVGAVLLVPDAFASDDFRRQLLGVRQRRELSMAVDGQPDEHEGK
jgi:hypothetical protein